MLDQQEMRIWQENRQAFAAEAGTLIDKIMHAFRVLHRIEWSAPWRKEQC